MKNYISILSLLCLFVFACKRTNTMQPETIIDGQALVFQDSSCGDINKTVKKVINQAGVVRYNQFEQRYTIVVTIPGTYDSQDVGVVCNLPSELKKDELSIVFDGQYRSYDKQPAVKMGGQSFYYLVLSKLTLKTSK